MPPENFELLRALKCVLGASEAPFLCMHAIHTYLQVAGSKSNDILSYITTVQSTTR